MTFKDERNGADRCWIWRDGYHYPQVSFTKPESHIKSVEYMRVMTRAEMEKAAGGEEGVDLMQMINSMQRTIEGQRKTINRMAKESNEDARDAATEARWQERQGEDYGSF